MAGTSSSSLLIKKLSQGWFSDVSLLASAQTSRPALALCLRQQLLHATAANKFA
jgi:hypothetical protein